MIQKYKRVIAVALTICNIATFEVLGYSNKKVFVNKHSLLFKGKILKIGEPVPESGRISSFRLVKYEVERVCVGKYAKDEIVVDHPVFSKNELASLEIGDEVIVRVSKSSTIANRFNSPGIRKPSDKVKVFYIAEPTQPDDSTRCGG